MKNVKSPLAARALRQAHLAVSGVWRPLPASEALLEELIVLWRKDAFDEVVEPGVVPHCARIWRRRQQMPLSVIHGDVNGVESTAGVCHDAHVADGEVLHCPGCCFSKIDNQVTPATNCCTGKRTDGDIRSPAWVPDNRTNEGVTHDDEGCGSSSLQVEQDDLASGRETVDG